MSGPISVTAWTVPKDTELGTCGKFGSALRAQRLGAKSLWHLSLKITLGGKGPGWGPRVGSVLETPTIAYVTLASDKVGGILILAIFPLKADLQARS